VNGVYYRDDLLAKKLLPDIFGISQGGVLSFSRTVHWRFEYETSSLSWSERCLTSFLQHFGHWIHRILTQSTIAPGVYCRRKFTDPEKQKSTRLNLINDKSIVDAAIGQWRHRLSACIRVSGVHFEHQE